ncbi:MAG: arsenate reductase ArsC [Anaerolineae bacterium]
MAEGLLRALWSDQVEVFSVGSKPSIVNPYAIRAMAEKGIDISRHRSKHLNEFLRQPFDFMITVCDNAAETCPLFPGKAQRIHWSFADPAAVGGADEEVLASFVLVRDDLEHTFKTWFQSLDLPQS